MHWRATATAIALGIAVSVSHPQAGPADATEPPCRFTNVNRIVAVGDVHGAYDRFMDILRAANVVDDRARWIGGKTHLVQLGDVVDRGPDSGKVLERLE